MLRITYIAFFAKHYFPTLSKSHLLNYPYYTIYYAIQDSMIFTIIISILQYCYSYVIHCNYIVTIIISTLYSYIYRYILSIKIYNNQYRYKYIESVIVTSINKQWMYIYTVYTYHNYTRINIILVYSNFFSTYHSYLLWKQWIIKLYEKRIKEYFSLPYDFTSWPKNRLKRIWAPLSGFIDFSVSGQNSLSSFYTSQEYNFCAKRQ